MSDNNEKIPIDFILDTIFGVSGETRLQQFVRRVFDVTQWIIVTAAVSAVAVKSHQLTLRVLAGLLATMLGSYLFEDLRKRIPVVGRPGQFAGQWPPWLWWLYTLLSVSVMIFIGNKLFIFAESVVAEFMKVGP